MNAIQQAASNHYHDYARPANARLRVRLGARLALLLILSGGINAGRAQSCLPPPSGLVSWWSGQGNAADQVGGNLGDLTNGGTYGLGEVGQGFVLGGAGFLRVQDAPNLHFSTGMTAEAWINPSSIGIEQTIISKWDATGAGGSEIQNSFTSAVNAQGYPYFGITTTGTGGGAVSATSTTKVPLNQWTHFAGTYDGSFVRVYLNGVLAGSSACTGNIFPGTNRLGIGAVVGGDDYGIFFSGSLDELSLYNRALTAAEIQSLYQAAHAGKCTVANPPTVSVQPPGGSFLFGATVTLAANAAGPQPYNYQWYFNNVLITAATNSSLVITNLTAAESGAYAVAVANDYGSVTSSVVVTASLAVPPGFSWYSPNADGTVFGVDAQTNVYVNRSGTVVVFNHAGTPVQTNAVCPVPGVAQMDAAGNIYFAGIFTPPVDFGGVTLSTNRWFLAKYTSGGALVWAKGVTPNSADGATNGLSLGDLRVAPGGNAYASVRWTTNSQFSSARFSEVLAFDSNGVGVWEAGTVNQFAGSQTTSIGGPYLGAASATNCYAVTAYLGAGGTAGSTLQDFPGGVQVTLANAPFFLNTIYFAPGFTGSHTVADAAGNIYNVENGVLTKRTGAGVRIWAASGSISPTAHTIAPDFWGGVHVADASGLVARYDAAGNPVWTNNFFSPCNAMVMDSQGNRFLSVDDGGLYALQPEPFAAPVITNAPLGFTDFGGGNDTLSVGASGGGPLAYYWLFQGNPITGATNSTLILDGTTSAESGAYSVIVSNAVGSVTSAPVTVRIKSVGLFLGNQMLTNGTYSFLTNPVVTVRSLFTNGSTFYTLDGSTPSFLSTAYAGPITITSNVTVNAIGYSADLSQSDLADPVNVVLPPRYVLTAYTLGGGTITLSQSGAAAASNTVTYLSNSVVTATANPASGWSFLDWQGGAGGTNPAISLTLRDNTLIQAVFGTKLSTTVVGNGQVIVYPPGGTYPYGSDLRLLGLPGPGSYFGTWGNAGSGTANPLYFTLTNANPTVSSLFPTTPANHVALTFLISGRGRVGVSPSGNVFTTGQQVTITATPDAAESFLGWGGEASGTQSPLNVTLNQSGVITANFSGAIAELSANASGWNASGFTFTLTSDPGSIYQILVSTNLKAWQSLGSVTNLTGQIQFIDSGAVGSSVRFYRAEQ